ncbi:MAG TPA: ISNCY family transposase [Candidatus Acidoferrum sp.]|nr:ISNCY family transposase [Candidatus Acidoferrum sp.]
MIASVNHQSWLFFFPLAQQAALLKDDLLEPVDQLLQDPQLVELVRQCLASRYPQSARTGRFGMAPDRLLRSGVLKHLKGWSFRELERELRCNLIYRRFTHFDAEVIPRYNCFSRLLAVLSPQVIQEIHHRVVGLACERGVAPGRRMRTDTTCIESNIHYPTDSSLLGDSIRVLTRSLSKIAEQCKQGALDVIGHSRAVKYRLLEISRAAKSNTEAGRARMRASYQKLLGLTRSVVRQSQQVLEQFKQGCLPVVGSKVAVFAQLSQLEHFLPLAQKVIRQTKDRVVLGKEAAEKVLSLFEPHSEVIRKGKAHKPNEFGRLVRIDEAENGIVSGYEVLVGNPADTTSFLPALQQHQAVFGRVPEMAVGDRGFFSARNEREAEEMGVKKVALPARGRLSQKRKERQKQRWFRRALRWRAGCESTISTLKHPFSMLRAMYKGDRGFQRYVGWSVITKNLFSIARWQERKKRKPAENKSDAQMICIE